MSRRSILIAAQVVCFSLALTFSSAKAADEATTDGKAKSSQQEAPVSGDNKTVPAPSDSTSTDNASESKAAEEAIQKARVEINRKRFPDAKQILKQAINSYPKNISLYNELYQTCIRANDWSDASFSLEKMMELDPAKEKECIVDYARALFQLRRYDKAKAAANKGLSLGKDRDQCYKLLAQIALRDKDEPAVILNYREYLKIKPGDGDIHWELANLLYKGSNGMKESLPEYKAASDARPMDSYGHERYAYLLLCNKEYDASINAYLKAIKVAKQADAVSRLNQALRYAKLQKKANDPAAQKPAQ